jgi:mannose-6-phosphate isomerase-like protein (cupin superfamily)
MKKYEFPKAEGAVRVCDPSSGADVVMNRACRTKVRDNETMHCHKKGKEYYIVTRGCAEIEVDGKPIEVKSEEVLMVEAGEWHKISKVIGETEYIVIKTKPDLKDKIVREQKSL